MTSDLSDNGEIVLLGGILTDEVATKLIHGATNSTSTFRELNAEALTYVMLPSLITAA